MVRKNGACQRSLLTHESEEFMEPLPFIFFHWDLVCGFLQPYHFLEIILLKSIEEMSIRLRTMLGI